MSVDDMVNCGNSRTLKMHLNTRTLIRTTPLLHCQLVCPTGHITFFLELVPSGSFWLRVPLKAEVLRFLHDVICETTLSSELNLSLPKCSLLREEREKKSMPFWLLGREQGREGSVSGFGTAGSLLGVLGDFCSCQIGFLQLSQPSKC